MNLHLLISLKHSSVSVSLKHRQHDNVLARNLQLAEDVVSRASKSCSDVKLHWCLLQFIHTRFTTYYLPYCLIKYIELRELQTCNGFSRVTDTTTIAFTKNTATSGSISPRLVRGYSCGRASRAGGLLVRAGYCIVLSINYAQPTSLQDKN